jgi:ABC-type polysaccharide/polyol phosphate transport system ATPase subunit
VKRLCTHAVWIDKGRLRAHGSTGEVLAAYSASLHHASPTLSRATVEL